MKRDQNNQIKEIETEFSLEQLNKIGNGSEEFVIEMLKQFLLTSRECAENMLSALKKGDWIKIKHAAHKGIPAYSILELDELLELLRTIESEAGSSRDHAFAGELIKLFVEKNKKVTAEINQYLKRSIEKKTVPV